MRGLALAASLLGVVGPFTSRAAEAPQPVTRQAYLMGTRATLVTLATDRSEGLAVLDRMLSTLERAEDELSTWRETSRLSAVNRQPIAEPQPLRASLCTLLAELSFWTSTTRGAFDPAIGSLVDAWGLRVGGRWPSAEALELARHNSGLKHLRVEISPCRVTRRRDVRLDAGGFGKGAALDAVAAIENRLGTGAWRIDLGGQVAVGGEDGPTWPVAIAHPRRRHEPAFELRLSEGSMATSGGATRDLLLAGRAIGHIIDPRDGQPRSRPESVTVWHERALAADVLSTALYVMGPEEGIEWADVRGIAACFFRTEGEAGVTLAATQAFRARFRRFEPGGVGPPGFDSP